MRRTLRIAATAAAVVCVPGCAATTADPPDPAPAPPAPPAACLLDEDELTAATGVRWRSDAVTASDTRCVYDPQPGREFVTVLVEPRTTTLDAVSALCDDGTVTRDGTHLACRFGDGGVFAATERGDELIAAVAARVPEGTTADRLAAALTAQLAR